LPACGKGIDFFELLISATAVSPIMIQQKSKFEVISVVRSLVKSDEADAENRARPVMSPGITPPRPNIFSA
jgi:hypothetical protein